MFLNRQIEGEWIACIVGSSRDSTSPNDDGLCQYISKKELFAAETASEMSRHSAPDIISLTERFPSRLKT